MSSKKIFFNKNSSVKDIPTLSKQESCLVVLIIADQQLFEGRNFSVIVTYLES